MGKIAAWIYDLQMRLAARQLNPRRRALVRPVLGRALEIGVGTGQNLVFYQPGARVIGIDPDAGMMGRARSRAKGAPVPVHLLAARGEALPFGDGSFDAIVVTLALCSVDSQDEALGEMRRVLKPGGKLHFMEHVRSETAGWARLQDLVTPIWKTVVTG
jgi:ubiquinone/menaquinone biosynthesis C-methylase UbiE